MLPVACLLQHSSWASVWIDPSGGWHAVVAATCTRPAARSSTIYEPAVRRWWSPSAWARDKGRCLGTVSALVGFLTVTPRSWAPRPCSPSFGAKVDTEHPAFTAGAIGSRTCSSASWSAAWQVRATTSSAKTKLPDFLAFFSGRRCVRPDLRSCPSSRCCCCSSGRPSTVRWSGSASPSWASARRAGIYAFFNRLLIPTGLHHALNNVFWFNLANINDIGRIWGSADRPVARSSPPAAHRSACTSPASTRPASSRS